MKLIQPISTKIAQLRRQAKLTQLELSRRTGLGNVRISKLESGARRPRLEELESIAKALGITMEFLTTDTDWQARPAENYDRQVLETLAVPEPPLRRGEFSFAERLRAGWKLNPRLVSDLERRVAARPNGLALSVHLQKFWVDSGPESIYWMQLAAADSYPIHAPLAKLGLRECPLICPGTRLDIGDVPRPGLWLKAPVSAAFFPQITLSLASGPQRVDCLVCFGDNRWVVIEVDGKAHNSRWDQLRERDLLWPLWRLTCSDVQEESMLTRLVKSYHEAFPLSAAKTSPIAS